MRKSITNCLYSIFVFSLMFSCKKEQGAAGLNSLVEIVQVSAGSACGNGGITINTGMDVNRNNILDANEISETQNVCNGVSGSNGYNSLIKTTNVAGNTICSNGGLQAQSGLDSNANGILDSNEVQQTQMVCNGANGGYDKQIALLIGTAIGSTTTTHDLYSSSVINFNVDNYTGVDSAVFYVSNAYVYNFGNTINFQLINVTDNTPINKTLLTTGSTNGIDLVSPNILTYLPHKAIQLGVQDYVKVQGQYGMGFYFYLLLYRK